MLLGLCSIVLYAMPFKDRTFSVMCRGVFLIWWLDGSLQMGV
jgi:hypothetical protein